MSLHRAWVCVAVAIGGAHANAAELFDTPGFQAPVRADPGSLLLLPGHALNPDSRVTLTNDHGKSLALEVVHNASTDNGLVVKMPDEVDATQRYRLRIADGTGTAELLLNDARPQWFAPRSLPVSGAGAAGVRELRLVGRNLATLKPAPRVRLSGPRVAYLDELPAEDATLIDYTRRFGVPTLPMGEYRVAVSGDGVDWIAVDGTLRITDNAMATQVFIDEERFGGCHADDMRDDTACLLAAIGAAQLAGGGVVNLGPGTWRFDDPTAADRAGGDGIPLVNGVSLSGRAAASTQLLRGARWNRDRGRPLLVLLGANRIADLRFDDAVRDRSRASPAFIRLGRSAVRSDATVRHVDDITIDNAAFAGADESIDVGALPLERLSVTHNLFRAWRLALALGGDASNLRDRFYLSDSLIAGNRFEPGSYLDVVAGQGARATEIGGAVRLVFADNLADGAALGGLDSDQDAAGWRAAYFWHLTGPQEQLLVMNNSVTCSGDKAGDGEAFAFDSNHNRFAFEGVRAVSVASRDSIEIAGPLPPASELLGLWVQVAAGTGVGQSRRITAVEPAGARMRIRVAPRFDVAPSAGSQVVVGRQFWQVYLLGNEIDQRTPLCRKSNRTGLRGGVISMWGSSSDSVIAGNRQYDTDGIVFQESFDRSGSIRQSFLEIRDNEIVGEYSARARESLSGIRASHGAAPDIVPPVLGLGVVIADNHIDGADGEDGAAIGIPSTWYRGPAPHHWPLLQQLLIFSNRIENVPLGISVPAVAQLRGGVAYDNSCSSMRERTRATPAQLMLLCAEHRETCECRLK